jgi:putative PIN family toxin of toxin-antitoxin system
MKIVLDTNCLLPAIFCNSPYYWVWDAFCEGRFVLCFSTDMYHEYEELLTQFYSPQISKSVIQTIMNADNIEHITPYFKWNLIATDPDDNKFVDCALNAGADYIVTNDLHFNVLKALDFPSIKVINIDTFKNILML